MEDTLRENKNICVCSFIKVLILVLMEDTLRAKYYVPGLSLTTGQVLILVLMEDTLRDMRKHLHTSTSASLNPCFNGRYS